MNSLLGCICCHTEHARKALNMCYREKTFRIRAIRTAIMVSVSQLPLNQRRHFKYDPLYHIPISLTLNSLQDCIAV